MPKLKLNENQEKDKNLLAMIAYGRIDKRLGKYDAEAVSSITRVCMGTAYNKLNNPETFTLGELRRLRKALGIKSEDFAKIF